MAKSSNGKLDLVGTWEAAVILDVERPRIGRWLKLWRIWMFGDKAWQDSGGKKGIPPHHLAKPQHWTSGPEPETKIPKPIANLKSGPVWHRRDIERFARERSAAAAAD